MGGFDKSIGFQSGPITEELIAGGTGSEADGAVVRFVGRARNASRGKDVLYLEYEIYPGMARKQMERIVDEAREKWGISGCTVVHRYGRVDPGEASIVISVASPHRDEAFRAVRYIIDSIKLRVPIWKKEFYSDGSLWITEGS